MLRLVITTRELRAGSLITPAAATIPTATVGSLLTTHPSGLLQVDFGPHGTKLVWPQAVRHIDGQADLVDFIGESLVGFAPAHRVA